MTRNTELFQQKLTLALGRNPKRVFKGFPAHVEKELRSLKGCQMDLVFTPSTVQTLFVWTQNKDTFKTILIRTKTNHRILNYTNKRVKLIIQGRHILFKQNGLNS